MQATICDICKIKPAYLKIKVKVSRRIFFGVIPVWSPWRQIDVCDECGGNIFELTNSETQESIFSSAKKVVERPEPKNTICTTKEQDE